MAVGIFTFTLQLPGCSSLKEKRARLSPLLHRLHREFNISVAELDHQDFWQSARIGCSAITSHPTPLHQMFTQVETWIEKNCPDVYVENSAIEIL